MQERVRQYILAAFKITIVNSQLYNLAKSSFYEFRDKAMLAALDLLREKIAQSCLGLAEGTWEY